MVTQRIVAGGLEPVADAFEAILASGCPGAMVAVRDGEVVLQLDGGHDATGRAFTVDTPVFLYSAVKPVAALTALLAVADGELSLDVPVAQVWPAFGAHGKDRVTVREALAHGAAVPGWRDAVTIEDLCDRVAAAEALAASAPWWTPGEPGEHATSYGHLVDAILRHATGRDVASWWEGVLAATGLQLALTPEQLRVPPAPLDDPGGAYRTRWAVEPGLLGELLRNPAEVMDAEVVNGPRVRSLVAPAITGYAPAGDLARLYAWWTGDGGARRLGRGLRDESLAVQVVGHDHVLDGEVAWGLGPQVSVDPPDLGMGGVGGCVGAHDPVRGLSIGLTTPRLSPTDWLEPLDEALAALP